MQANGITGWKCFLFIGTAIFLAACGGGSNKRVYFGNLEDGSNVESPFKVDMKAENLIVEPATLGVTEGHGHFHIIVDAPLASPAEPMPKDVKHIHYGDGQTSTTLDLPVGQHTLILQFAKGDHVPYDPPVYQQIQLNVTKQNAADTASQAKPVDSTAAPAVEATSNTPAGRAATDSVKVPDAGAPAKDAAIAKKDSAAKAEVDSHEGHKKESRK